MAMLCWKYDRDKALKRPLSIVRRFALQPSAQGGEEASIGCRSFLPCVAGFAAPRFAFTTLLVLAFVCWGAGLSRAQVLDAEKANYADALAYCRGDVARPIALRSDKRVLCLDGQISDLSEILPAVSLKQGGLFVVRGRGGNMAVILAFTETLLAREVTVIVNDYCVAICANYLFMASLKTFVPKDALVAWTNHPIQLNNCIGFYEARDRGPPLFQQWPCDPLAIDSEMKRSLDNFYSGRVQHFDEPPESFFVRRTLKRKFDTTGKYPTDVYWTWNPRYYASAIKTKVLYEAYPASQDDVDAIVARLGLKLLVIYDP